MNEFELKTRPPDETSNTDLIQQVAKEEIAAVQPDPKALINETKSLEFDQLKIRVDKLEQELRESRELHNLRKDYTDKLFRLITSWLIIVLVFLILSASIKSHFNLSDSVLIAFITSTTVAVIGLFVIVAKWLFPTLQRDRQDKEKE